ncbi:hypothetical protein [Photobacterium sp. Alg240-V54]|uniref:hypothetical protein n=1 Tax=Photobacterium sp. Alg240-V54 TaxID=2305995 RepID=UPI0013D85C3A|nr:hypothetical protein [Photobacterium sp. Alg240-V54]
MNTTNFPELPIKLADSIVVLYLLLDAQKEYSDSLGEQNSILELQLYLQNVCHFTRTVYSSSITIKKKPILEQLIRKFFSLNRQLNKIAKHYKWSQNTDVQIMKQMDLIMKVLAGENDRLNN